MTTRDCHILPSLFALLALGSGTAVAQSETVFYGQLKIGIVKATTNFGRNMGADYVFLKKKITSPLFIVYLVAFFFPFKNGYLEAAVWPCAEVCVVLAARCISL